MGSIKIKFKPRLKRLLPISLFIFLISYYDPFGLDNPLSIHSNNIFYHIVSPWFDKKNDDQISVILLRENELEEGWPPSYEYHADVLATLLDNEPNAIFIDLLFESTNDTEVKHLREVLQQKDRPETKKIPVYLAMGRDENLSNAFLEKLFERPIDNISHYPKPDNLHHVKPTSIVINSKQGIRYPLTNLPYDQLKQSLYNSKYSGRILLSLPGQRYCNDKLNLAENTDIETINSKYKECANNFIKEHGSQDFYITWRDLFSDKTGSPLGNQCVELSSSALVRTIKLLFLNVSNGIKAIFAYKPTPSEKQQCVPHQTLSVTHLFKDPDRKTIKELINNKFVFYGVKLENTNDVISPPTHEVLPGIYAHTMALENYLTYKEQMTVDDSPPLQISFLSGKVIWTFLVCFTLALCNEFFRYFYVKKSVEIKSSKKVKKKKYITKLLQPYILPSITLTYIIVIVCWIIFFAMILPFQLFNIAPLSGFNFAVATGFINLPNIVQWWNKKLDKFGLGENFNT